MKKFFLSAVTAVCAFCAIGSEAQDYEINVYAGLVGGTNSVAPNSTNSYSGIACDQYNRADLQITLAATAANAGVAQVFAYKTLDSSTYETSPFLSATVALNGTTPVTTIIASDIGGAAGIKFKLGNTNTAAIAFTNVTAKIRFKANALRFKTN